MLVFALLELTKFSNILWWAFKIHWRKGYTIIDDSIEITLIDFGLTTENQNL